MKVISAKPIDNGKRIEIETNHKGNYHYIWLDAEDLRGIADMMEKA